MQLSSDVELNEIFVQKSLSTHNRKLLFWGGTEEQIRVLNKIKGKVNQY